MASAINAGSPRIKVMPGIAMISPRAEWCDARCYPVRVGDGIPGAIVFPEIAKYPAAQVEVIAAVALRDALSIVDGDRAAERLETGMNFGDSAVRTVITPADYPGFDRLLENAQAGTVSP